MLLNKKLCLLVVGSIWSLQLLASTHPGMYSKSAKHYRSSYSFKQTKHQRIRHHSPQRFVEHPWSLVASLGYTQYQNMYSNDGQTPISKLSFGKELFSFNSFDNTFKFGIETGIQNGNTMRIYSADLAQLGSSPVETTVKPIIDLLATIKTTPINNTPFFLQFKGGPAYIHWQFDNNDTIHNQTTFTTELQGGIGYAIKDYLELSLLYQGLMGGRPELTVNAQNVDDESIRTIPLQHGILLSLSLAFN